MAKKKEKRSYGRMKSDTNKSWDAYVLYRDMGPRVRSCQKVGDVLGKTVNLITNWCTKHEWVTRVAMWDKKKDDNQAKLELFSLRASQIRQLKLSRRIQDAANEEILKYLDKIAELNGPTIGIDESSRVAERGVKMERLALGEATDIMGNKDNQFDWTKLSTEKIKQLREILTAAKVSKNDEET